MVVIVCFYPDGTYTYRYAIGDYIAGLFLYGQTTDDLDVSIEYIWKVIDELEEEMPVFVVDNGILIINNDDGVPYPKEFTGKYSWWVKYHDGEPKQEVFDELAKKPCYIPSYGRNEDGHYIYGSWLERN